MLVRWLPFDEALVLSFDVAAIAFLLSCVSIWRNDDLKAIRDRGARDDGGRVLLLVVSLTVLATVLIAIGIMLTSRSTLTSFSVVLVLGTLVLAWLFANIVYAFHYAHCYYDQTENGDVEGLKFPGADKPLFADFCYVALTVGMTCQVSDVQVETRQMRRLTTVQGLQAFFFNLGVLALTVNVLSSTLNP